MSDQEKTKGKPRSVKTIVELPDGEQVSIYAGPSILEALQIVSMDMDLYKGVRLSQLLGALYRQGKKNGRAEAFDMVDAVRETLPHRNPGQPRKKKKQGKKKLS
jgi:hypothetical protein